MGSPGESQRASASPEAWARMTRSGWSRLVEHRGWKLSLPLTACLLWSFFCPFFTCFNLRAQPFLLWEQCLKVLHYSHDLFQHHPVYLVSSPVKQIKWICYCLTSFLSPPTYPIYKFFLCSLTPVMNALLPLLFSYTNKCLILCFVSTLSLTPSPPEYQ